MPFWAGSMTRRLVGHYLAAALVLTLYGGEV
jgi:hypothetical protein